MCQQCCLLTGMPMGLAYKEQRQHQTCQGKAYAEQERLGPQRIRGGEVACSDGGERDRAVACRFIEPHCQSTPGGPWQVWCCRCSLYASPMGMPVKRQHCWHMPPGKRKAQHHRLRMPPLIDPKHHHSKTSSC